jgi:hypothetical protein
MRQRHAYAHRLHARADLQWCGIDVGADFHTLSKQQVERLAESADRDRYQKPPRANGSRLRYYHDRLQRRATASPQA